ncbi:MAG: hypothetical protein N4A33_07565 [Bacteriovoracaceae bacterium]|jgi:predicted Ser/Thr protein kinase|nr:hypothetical protein [Bacteriovoracaceae bacterium]
MDWLAEVNKEEKKLKQIFSFNEYMDNLENDFKNQLRTTGMFLKDMFEFFGKGEKGGFKLFKKEYPFSNKVAGGFKVQEKIYQNLLNFTEEGFNNKFLLLVGPNGSSKSSIVNQIMKAAEEYSKENQGALFTFSWIFPIDTYTKGSLGLNSKASGSNMLSYAHLQDNEISAILTSELKDHPFLLIPRKTRQKMINNFFSDSPDVLLTIQNSYLYNGDISKRNKLIFDALLKNYEDDFSEVMKHIRVERYFIDKRYSNGAVTIEPQMHIDAKAQQITMDRRLASLPPSLQSLNLFSLSGELVMANRGILEYSDLLKRPLDAFKYLLMTMETKNINLGGILTELDTFFIGSSNEVHLAAFKQHPDYKSFKGRFSFIKVPYLLDYQEELSIYEEQIINIKDKTGFEPLALEALCLWSVMTRMRHPQAANFKSQNLGKIAEKLTPIEKALFIAESKIPEYLNQEEQSLLKLHKDDIIEEFEDDALYEGMFGISPREVKQIIYELSSDYKNITFIEILEYLTEASDKKAEYDFLNINPQGDFHNSKKFLYLIEQHCLNEFDSLVRESLGLVDNRSYEDYIAKYVMNINAIIKGEKVKNSVTNKFEDPDKFFIKEFEQNIHLKENADSFRSHIISKLGAWALDNPGEKIVYTQVLDGISKQLKESFRNEQKKIIKKVANDLVYYVQEDKKSGLSAEGKEQIEKILKTLTDDFKFTQTGSIKCLKYLIQKRYDNA